MKRRVVILGGGVAGMSAAHELVERGFDVTVYEQNGIPGGKARSLSVPNSATSGRNPLPGEHGFRFFPGFYRHLPNTMQRIPYKQNPKGVFGNLVEAREAAVNFRGQRHVILPTRFPRTPGELRDLLVQAGHLPPGIGLTIEDMEVYVESVWRILTSCEERRADEYEKQSWLDFIHANGRSETYGRYLGGTTRVLVAADPKHANARTVGDILVQMLFDVVEPGVSADRVLNGPTNEVWIEPWLHYLRGRGVDYRFNATVRSLRFRAGCVTGAVVTETVNGRRRNRLVTADFYVAAVPVEVMAELLRGTPAIVRADAMLEGVQRLARDVSWMNGIQLYLSEDVPLTHGHQMYLDAPWALTSLSQAQFWRGSVDLPRDYGDGHVNGIISVDISEWDTPGTYVTKPAKRCTPEQVTEEVWRQLKSAVDGLEDRLLRRAFLDPALRRVGGRFTNAEPLLVNKVNTWRFRPTARTRIPNLFLASDYVRTYTDLATMEAANEAARRAVNGILDEAGSDEPECPVWKLHEPLILRPWRLWDLWRYRHGRPWGPDINPLVDAVQTVLVTAASVAPPPPGAARVTAEQPRATAHPIPEPRQAALGDFLFHHLRPAVEDKDLARLAALFTPDASLCVTGRFLTLGEFLAHAKARFNSAAAVEIDLRRAEKVELRRRDVFARFAVDFVLRPAERRGEEFTTGSLSLTLVRARPRRARVRRGTPAAAASPGWLIRAASYEPAPRLGEDLG